jgi:hypothetical protein
MGYNPSMIGIRKTEAYAKWIDGLRDVRARARILARVERLATGNPGDVKPVGEGVSESGSIMAPVIECITRSGRGSLLSCWPEETRLLRLGTSKLPCA